MHTDLFFTRSGGFLAPFALERLFFACTALTAQRGKYEHFHAHQNLANISKLAILSAFLERGKVKLALLSPFLAATESPCILVDMLRRPHRYFNITDIING